MPSNNNLPAHPSQQSASNASSPVPGVSPAGAAGIPLDAGRTQPNTRIAQNAKAIGGGLEDGSTDFGPDTKATIGCFPRPTGASPPVDRLDSAPITAIISRRPAARGTV